MQPTLTVPVIARLAGIDVQVGTLILAADEDPRVHLEPERLTQAHRVFLGVVQICDNIARGET